jgi:hypothetical protein
MKDILSKMFEDLMLYGRATVAMGGGDSLSQLLHRMEVRLHANLKKFDPEIVNAAVRRWKKDGCQRYTQADLLLSDAREVSISGSSKTIWIPNTLRDSLDYYTIQWPIQAPGTVWGLLGEEPEPAKPPTEPEFEVDLMEPLVGWKVVDVVEGILKSQFYNEPYSPLQPFTAKCHCSRSNSAKKKAKHHAPALHGSCGIYAVDIREEVGTDHEDEFEVLIEIYGWGKYVRGETGWRAEHAYPKAIHLRSGQGGMVEPLRKYRVPIYLDVPTTAYDPTEEGYEHGQDEAPRDFSATEGADSTEDQEG